MLQHIFFLSVSYILLEFQILFKDHKKSKPMASTSIASLPPNNLDLLLYIKSNKGVKLNKRL